MRVPWLKCLFATAIIMVLASRCFGEGRDISYHNYSEEDLRMERLLLDGEEFPRSRMILVSGKSIDILFEFPRRLPEVFTIQYRVVEHGRKSDLLTQEFSGREVKALMGKIAQMNPVTLHLIYTDQHKFIAKLEENEPDGAPHRASHLWPDENNPEFIRYLRLLQAAEVGDANAIRQSLAAGVPVLWPNDPVNVTPLERAVLDQRDEAFRVLIDTVPADYPISRMQNCVRGAARLGELPILQRLLENPLAQRIQGFALQEVFYTACDSQSDPEILAMLLKTYEVGVDFRVRDYGHTLLFVAANAGNEEIVRWLLAHGANRNLRLKNGETAMDRAKSPEIRKLLAGE